LPSASSGSTINRGTRARDVPLRRGCCSVTRVNAWLRQFVHATIPRSVLVIRTSIPCGRQFHSGARHCAYTWSG
jgi:hypothetical protein